MNSTAPGSIPNVTRTSQAHVPAHSDGISPNAHLPNPSSPARSQLEPLAVKRVFRRTTSAIGGEEGGEELQQHEAELEAPSTCGMSVAERVAALPPIQLHRWLSNAGVTRDVSPIWGLPWTSIGGRGSGGGSGGGGGGNSTPSTAAAQRRGPWGFASGMPSLEELFSAAAARRSPQSPDGNHLTASATAPAAPHNPGPGSPDQMTTAQPPAADGSDMERAAGLIESQPAAGPCGDMRTYVQRLGDSRAFHCPDATEAMAEACGATQSLRALQGSLVVAHLGRERTAAVDMLRSSVKSRMNAGWALEAVCRGVAVAKQGDHEGALTYYNKALVLNPRCCDAFVARGAAHANQKQFERAIDDLKKAREIDPGDVNAAKYLDAIRQRMARQLSAPSAVPAAATAAASRDQVRPRLQNHGAATVTESGAHTVGSMPASGMPPSAPAASQQMPSPGTRIEAAPSRARLRPSASSSGSGSSGGNSSGSSPVRADDRMDVQTALSLVSKHYSSRKSQGKGSRSFKRDRQDAFDSKKKRTKEKRSKHKKIKQ